MRWLNGSAWASRAMTVVVFGAILLVRCGGQVITHADDVANVTDLVGDMTDQVGGDEGDDDDLEPVEIVDEPGFNYAAADGSFAATFPDAAINAENVTTLDDGTEVLTVHHGDWHVRRLLVPAEIDLGGTDELHALAESFSEGAGTSLVGEDLVGSDTEVFRTSNGEREMEGTVLTGTQVGAMHAYYVLWHSPPPGHEPDVDPLYDRFRWT